MNLQEHANLSVLQPTFELVEKLALQLSEATKGPGNETGACVYNTPNGPKCAELSPSACSALGGNYLGGKCH